MTQPTLKKILAIGAPLMDRIFKVPDSFIENSQSLTGKKGGSGMINFEEQKALTQQVGPELLLSSGGCAANAVKCMSKLGKTCALFGGIGQDDLGKDYKKLMNEYGVKTFFSTKKTPTGQVLCFVTPDGQRTMLSFMGASAEISHEDLSPKHFEGVELMHIAAYDFYNEKLTEKAFRLAKAAGAKISLDLASFEVVKKFKEEILYYIKEYVDLVFANEDEAKALTGLPEKETCIFLGNFCDIAVVLMGKKGCWVNHDKHAIACPAFPIRPLDTTGAGDMFMGAFLSAYLDNLPVEECARNGALAGAAIVQVLGATLPENAWTILKNKMHTHKQVH